MKTGLDRVWTEGGFFREKLRERSKFEWIARVYLERSCWCEKWDKHKVQAASKVGSFGRSSMRRCGLITSSPLLLLCHLTYLLFYISNFWECLFISFSTCCFQVLAKGGCDPFHLLLCSQSMTLLWAVSCYPFKWYLALSPKVEKLSCHEWNPTELPLAHWQIIAGTCFSQMQIGVGNQCLHKPLPVVLFAQLYVGKNHVRIKQ